MTRRERAKPPPDVEEPLRLPTADWLTAMPASDVHPSRLAWVWPERLALASPVILEGRKGTLKSTLLAALAAAFTGGKPLPGMRKKNLGGVLWMPGEEPVAEVVIPRLQAAGADLRRVHIPGADHRGLFKQRPSIPSCTRELVTLAKKTEARLLILDPIDAWADAGLSIESTEGARAVMAALSEWGAECKGAAICTRNLTKGRHGDVLDAGRGSGTLGDHARGILRTDRHPDDYGAFVLTHVRNSYGEDAPALRYRVVPGEPWWTLKWEGEVDLTAEVVAEASGTPADLDERAGARELVRRCVGNRWRSVKEIQAEAALAGLGWKSVQRAKTELSVPHRRTGGLGAAGTWEWGPPLDGWPKGL